MKPHNKIQCCHGQIRLDAINQGRIFAELDGELLHRLDTVLAPDPVAFRNLGGNSLWPAPEGGDYAFNYPPDPDGGWMVQAGVNSAESVFEDAPFPTCSRRVTLHNRMGYELEVEFRRSISPLSGENSADCYALRFTGYREEDSLILSAPCAPESAVIAAWSLEQFPGSRDILAFGKFDDAFSAEAVNRDYYGDPGDALGFRPGFFRFRPAGTGRFQIGVRASVRPAFIGAYDPSRQLLVLRTSQRGCGRRIDIADNAQRNGVFGAEDQYSIFNGGPLDFFELETIAPVFITGNGAVSGSHLRAESRFYRGPKANLERMLHDVFGMPDSFLTGEV